SGRADLVRENDEIRLADEERSLLARDEELARVTSQLATERKQRERERARIALDLDKAREKVNGAARAVESASARAAASRNELQRIDGDISLVRGQTTALREAAERAAAALRAGVVVAPSGLLVLPGLVRFADPRRRADQEARAQLRGMASRLREELGGAERALAQLQEERASAEVRSGEHDERLDVTQRSRGDAERAVDELASTDADVRDLVRVADARATSIERERS